MSAPVRVYIELRGYGARGTRYQVRMNKPDGMLIIDSTTEPLFATARALLSKGITGKIEIWDSKRAFPRMRGDIERHAGLTVTDGKDGMALRRYVQRSAGGDFENEGPQGARSEVELQGCILRASRADEAT